MNNLRSFMVVREIDGVPFYWRPQVKEWVRDKPLGKIYKRLAVAEQVAAEYYGTVVELKPAPIPPTYKQLVADTARLQGELDFYRRVVAVLIDDLGGEITIPLESLQQAGDIEVIQETTDEAGPDIVIRSEPPHA